MNGFWLVWSPEGTAPPTKQYATWAAANKDADALVRKFPNQLFFVLKATEMHTASLVATRILLSEPS